MKHREILAREVGPCDHLLDIGCGWGRLLDMLPVSWHGRYFGIDLVEDFIEMARERHPGYLFRCGNVVEILQKESLQGSIDLAVLVSFRPMIKRNLGGEYWEVINKLLKRVAGRLLFLEYDEDDEGSYD